MVYCKRCFIVGLPSFALLAPLVSLSFNFDCILGYISRVMQIMGLSSQISFFTPSP